MINAVNAAPMVKDLGIQNMPTDAIARLPESVPQHLPKVYMWAQKGRTNEELLVGVERENIFGDETFRMGGKYANHSTLFANAFNARANACVYKRLIPPNAGPESNITLWLDVLSTMVDVYERNTDGSIKTNVLGDAIVVGQVKGYKVKWVATSASTDVAAAGFGIRKMTTGDQFDPATNTQSERYPMFDFVVDSKGEYGNNLGIRFWSPRAELNQVPYRLMVENKAFPYFLSIVERQSANTTPVNKTTVFGEQNLMVTLKPDTIDPVTTKAMFIGDQFPSAYGNTTDPRYAIEYPPFGQFHIYQTNVDALTKLFHAAEAPYIDEHSDFTADAEDWGLFNIINGQTTTGVPYHSFIYISDSDSITFSQFTDVMAGGGSDGTMTDELFNEMVSQEIRRYRDRRDQLMDLAYHVESIFYDSGYAVETKMDLPSFISQRHDTFLVLGTHTWGERALTASEEHSLAVSLRARIQNYPESDYFGTAATRAMIMGCSGVIRNTKYRVPATYEIGIKFANYMGASNGEWKGAYKPDGNPGHLIEELTDLNMVWVPETVRNRYWDVGLNWIGRFDRSRFFIPAYKTVFPDDTSVLTSAITVMAVCQLNKIGHACWRNFSGVAYLSNLQLCERVNDYVRTQVKGKFDGRFIIKPDAYITEMDEARGFSWTLPIKIGAEGMKTLQTLFVQADRKSRMDAGE